MNAPAFNMPLPVLRGDSVTEREKELENYIFILKAELDWALNTLTKVANDHEKRIKELEE